MNEGHWFIAPWKHPISLTRRGSPVSQACYQGKCFLKNTLIMGRNVQDKDTLSYWLFIRPYVTAGSTLPILFNSNTKGKVGIWKYFHKTHTRYKIIPSSLVMCQLRVVLISQEHIVPPQGLPPHQHTGGKMEAQRVQLRPECRTLGPAWSTITCPGQREAEVLAKPGTLVYPAGPGRATRKGEGSSIMTCPGPGCVPIPQKM